VKAYSKLALTGNCRIGLMVLGKGLSFAYRASATFALFDECQCLLVILARLPRPAVVDPAEDFFGSLP
jgi:hypothetical protein